MSELFHQYKFILVIAILGVAALLATEKGKLPLALRGMKRVLQRDKGESVTPTRSVGIPLWKRLLAFVIVLLAFALAVS